MKIHIVKYSRGMYEDYTVNNLEDCFRSLLVAEKAREALEISMKEVAPFPFDWCTKDDFEIMWAEGKALETDIDIFMEWENSLYEKQEFNSAWVETLNLID